MLPHDENLTAVVAARGVLLLLRVGHDAKPSHRPLLVTEGSGGRKMRRILGKDSKYES